MKLVKFRMQRFRRFESAEIDADAPSHCSGRI